jgi:hypothetical protein
MLRCIRDAGKAKDGWVKSLGQRGASYGLKISRRIRTFYAAFRHAPNLSSAMTDIIEA